MINWKEEDIPDLTGKIVLVTGGNSGLGFETVRVAAKKGATVIMASRNLERADNALQRILAEIPNAHIDVMLLELADLASIEIFAVHLLKKYNRLDYLFNNAGTMMIPYETTIDGIEKQFGVNYLGHFALTGRLLPLIVKTPNSRVITISSAAHNVQIDFDDINMEKNYNRIKAYMRSKAANILFAYELQRKFDLNRVESKSLAAHPGFAATNIPYQEDGPLRNKVGRILFRIQGFFLAPILSQSAYKGALPQLMAAFYDKAEGGTFYGPRFTYRGRPKLIKSAPYTYDKEVAKQLWEVSEKLTDVHFDFLRQDIEISLKHPKRRES